MIARKDAIEQIVKSLSLFVQEVKGFVAIQKYDISIYAENVLIPILNAVYELNLINANSERKNFPAVDLIDRTNRISFQTTVSSGQDKVNDTLQKFIDHKLHLEFDQLYIYVLTEKETKYNHNKLREIAIGQFDVINCLHIIDFTDLLKRIDGIAKLDRLNAISRIFQQEFSAAQIDARTKKFKDGYLSSTPEQLFLNITRIKFSDHLYMASPLNDQSVDLKSINADRRKQYLPRIKYSTPHSTFHYTLTKAGIFLVDWIIFQNKLITFRNLQDPSEPLSKHVDAGTIEKFHSSEFYKTNEDYLRVFKSLLRNSLRHLAYTKTLEWINDRKIFRFRNDEDVPREKKTIWKGKKESMKTVIFEVMTKKKSGVDSHIICFRSMAFKPSFQLLGDNWYLSINPTWSFTNPGGHETSRYEPDYMSGLKRLENNNTVYYQFRFFAYFLSNTAPLFVEKYPYLQILPAESLEFSPAIIDSKWLPMKEYSAINEREAELFEDKELNSNSFQ